MSNFKLKDPQTCRIFFSSPFGGMEDEREELTRKYFPQIQHFCSLYGVNFVAVDMRWGITSEASSNSKVINICLRELDRSDFFAGFFGQRYGWHGRDDDNLQDNFDNALGRYPWLENFRDKSVTELEFLHGHLNNPGALPAVICFRDKSYDDKEREKAQEKGDKKQIFKYSAESDKSTKLMEDLKLRCDQTKEKTYGVHLSYPDPLEGAKLMFDAIWKFLNNVLPELQTVTTETKRSKLLAQHNAFLASRHKMYGVGDKNIRSLLNLLNEECPFPLLVTGSSGIGKSTLLSVFISRVKSEYRSQFSVAYHCVGHAEESSGPDQILQRLTEELEFASDVMEGKEEKKSQKKTEVQDVRDIINQLAAAISKIQSKGKQCIVIIDGVEKASKAKRTEEVLFWLPHKLPEGTIVIVSANSSQPEILDELSKRSFNKMEIQEMSEEMRQEFAKKTLLERGKELSPSQMKKIVETAAAENPRYLKVLLNELIVFGYFRLLDQKIDSLVKCESIDELFEKVLERLEDDNKESGYEGNLVQQVTCVIFLSRQGMSEAEIVNMFNIPSHVWSPFFFSINMYLLNQGGLIKKKYTQLIADYFEEQMQRLPKLRSSCKNNDLARVSLELPFAYQSLNDSPNLANTLTHLSVLSCLIEKQCLTELYDLWESTGYGWRQITERYLTAVDVQVADVYIIQQEEGTIHQQTPGSLVNEVNMKESLNRESAMYKLATTYHNNSKLQKSLDIHLQVLKDRERRVPDLKNACSEDLEGLGNSYNGIGTNYLIIGDYMKAEEYLKKSLECSEIGLDKNNESICHMNLANIYTEMGEHHKAMKCLEKAIQILQQEGATVELLEKEMKNGNSHLIDGTLPLVHMDILKYLIKNKQEEVARKVLKTLVKTKAVTPLDYVLLKEVNTKLNPGDKAQENDDYDGSMSVDEALKEWPSDSKLLEYKIRNLINSEDSQALIDFFNSVCPGIYNITSLVNFILGMFATTEKFSTKMFVEFNENALSHLPKTEVECIKNCLRNTAESYEREKILDKSLELYKQWIEIDIDNPYPYFKVSYCLALSTGDIDEAKKYCTEARERAEKSSPSQAQLLQKANAMPCKAANMRCLLWISVVLSVEICQCNLPLVITWATNDTHPRNVHGKAARGNLGNNHHLRNRQHSTFSTRAPPRNLFPRPDRANSHVSRQNIHHTNWNRGRPVPTNGNRDTWNSRRGLVVPREDSRSEQQIIPGVSLSNFTTAQKKEIVDLHNKIRRSVSPRASNMKKMKWDTTLEKLAQQYAETCSGSHNAERHKRKWGDFRNVGENIHHTWDWVAEYKNGILEQKTLPLNLTKILHRWWKEKDKFDYRSPNACSGCGHYIQMVKDVSYAIGCGTALCETVKGRSYQNAHIFVCNYGDGYNESPEPYAEGQACSDCPTGHPVCVQGLCDAR
uniref:Peptidase inhibitor 16 n=1 Tax=Magallana gigas TaxID=29159 RepID=K1QLA2_MAGGI